MDDRNFRSAYYEKVGCRSVEERKSLEILLKEKPLNRSKLKQVCMVSIYQILLSERFIPANYNDIIFKFDCLF